MRGKDTGLHRGAQGGKKVEMLYCAPNDQVVGSLVLFALADLTCVITRANAPRLQAAADGGLEVIPDAPPVARAVMLFRDGDRQPFLQLVEDDATAFLAEWLMGTNEPNLAARLAHEVEHEGKWTGFAEQCHVAQDSPTPTEPEPLDDARAEDLCQRIPALRLAFAVVHPAALADSGEELADTVAEWRRMARAVIAHATFANP